MKMVAKMNCQTLCMARKNKEEIHKAEIVHISIVNNKQNYQLLVEVHALTFKKKSQCVYAYIK